jgi:hypothetical protein
MTSRARLHNGGTPSVASLRYMAGKMLAHLAVMTLRPLAPGPGCRGHALP